MAIFDSINTKAICHTALAMIVVITMSACGQSGTIKDNVQNSEMKAEEALRMLESGNQPSGSLKIDNTPWYGSQAISMQSSRSLPQELTETNAITLTFSQPVSYQEAAQKIETATGIPVRLSKNIYEETLGDLSERRFIPSGGQEVSGGRVVWSGSLTNLLNQMENIYGAEWRYDNGQIAFASEITKTFMLNALANDLTLSGSVTSSSGSSAGAAAPQISVSESTSLEIWGEISDAVTSIVGSFGQISFSPSTGSITITGRPDVLKRAENYLRYQNQMRLRRIAVSVQVLSVTTADTLNFDVDVESVIKGALGNDIDIVSSLNTSGDNVAMLTKDAAGAGSFTASLEASKGIERAEIMHSGSVVTLSDQPAPLQVSEQIAYLERVTASGDDAGSVSLEPGTIDVGLFMTVLPRIVDNDKILMRLSIAITDADRNFRTFGTDEVTIELPEIETTGFLQNAVVGDGETLVLAGFEKRQNSLNDGVSFMGASRATTRSRNLLVLMIKSHILPEQPITVIGQ